MTWKIHSVAGKRLTRLNMKTDYSIKESNSSQIGKNALVREGRIYKIKLTKRDKGKRNGIQHGIPKSGKVRMI
jgi:hypothetical protein